MLLNVTVTSKRACCCGRYACREFAFRDRSFPLTPVLSDRFREKSENFVGNG